MFSDKAGSAFSRPFFGSYYAFVVTVNWGSHWSSEKSHQHMKMSLLQTYILINMLELKQKFLFNFSE